jgi:hypothetical protein
MQNAEQQNYMYPLLCCIFIQVERLSGSGVTGLNRTATELLNPTTQVHNEPCHSILCLHIKLSQAYSILCNVTYHKICKSVIEEFQLKRI